MYQSQYWFWMMYCNLFFVERAQLVASKYINTYTVWMPLFIYFCLPEDRKLICRELVLSNITKGHNKLYTFWKSKMLLLICTPISKKYILSIFKHVIHIKKCVCVCVCVCAVSYTHLDVYKRQQLHCPAIHRKQIAIHAGHFFGLHALCWYGSVSYTHLDVYKRQTYDYITAVFTYKNKCVLIDAW